VHAFDVLGDPVRRRILELLADGELTSGAVCTVIQREFAITQPAVSQHLRVLREQGFATVRRPAPVVCTGRLTAAARRRRLARPVPALLGMTRSSEQWGAVGIIAGAAVRATR